MNKYIHSGTSLGTIQVSNEGIEVPCKVSIVCRPGRGPIVTHDIEYMWVRRTAEHEAEMAAFIHSALAKGKSLADAYIAARESEASTASRPKDFSQRTTIFSCGEFVGDSLSREFEVYVQDLHDPSIRYLTLATGVGTGNERHLVLHSDNLKDFLEAMVDLQATRFGVTDDEEAA